VTKRNAKRKNSLKTTEGARITTYIVDGLYPIIVALKERDVVTDERKPLLTMERLCKKERKCLPNITRLQDFKC
jgi:hypothetical protein